MLTCIGVFGLFVDRPPDPVLATARFFLQVGCATAFLSIISHTSCYVAVNMLPVYAWSLESSNSYPWRFSTRTGFLSMYLIGRFCLRVSAALVLSGAGLLFVQVTCEYMLSFY